MSGNDRQLIALAKPEDRAQLERKWRRGAACLKHYPRDGAAEAKRAHRTGEHRLIRLSHSPAGDLDLVAGFPACPIDEGRSVAIDQWDSILVDCCNFDVSLRCYSLVADYATSYDRRMVQLEPKLLQACSRSR